MQPRRKPPKKGHGDSLSDPLTEADLQLHVVRSSSPPQLCTQYSTFNFQARNIIYGPPSVIRTGATEALRTALDRERFLAAESQSLLAWRRPTPSIRAARDAGQSLSARPAESSRNAPPTPPATSTDDFPHFSHIPLNYSFEVDVPRPWSTRRYLGITRPASRSSASTSSTPVVRRAGWRLDRPTLLTEDDLYIGFIRPPLQSTLRHHQKCAICWQIKSHPVSYECGHSHCYVCIRLWLEHEFTCPECTMTMHRRPVVHWGETHGIAYDHPDWKDESQVVMTYEGLRFPRRNRVNVA
ncbi:hypothetical protein C8R43DRAFT_1142890 [Mycena crocata]|nr:hypothetical protein C8R43DRAFT_1142890 [Mycena crocata]